MLTKKDAQRESCELSFIWGKMKTSAQETAPQIALRDASREVVAEGIYDFAEGGFQYSQALILQKVFC